MIQYQAPDPYPADRPGYFAAIFSSSVSVQRTIGKLVLPAQWRAPAISNLDQLREMNVVTNGGYIGTHDNALLDTIELIPQQTINQSIDKRRFIIKFNGNGGQYQDLIGAYAKDARLLQATVIGFNYRGVGHSQKTPNVYQDLITDGIAQVQRLLDAGVKPENILLDGHSLGGSLATMVAFHFHDLKKRVYLWNDRSLASLSKAAAGILAPELPGLIGASVETSFASTSWSVMKPLGWEANVVEAYREIPMPYKGYMVVAKASPYSIGDGVIKHHASLHRGLRKEERHATGHKVLARQTFFGGGHNLPREALISKENPHQNGQDLFVGFAMRLGGTSAL